MEGETIILQATEGQYYGLDEVGTRIWTLIAAPGSKVADVVEVLLSEYDVDRQQCSSEVVQMLDRLHAAKLIELV